MPFPFVGEIINASPEHAVVDCANTKGFGLLVSTNEKGVDALQPSAAAVTE